MRPTEGRRTDRPVDGQTSGGFTTDVHTNVDSWNEIFEKGLDRYIDYEVNERLMSLPITELHKDSL